MTDLCRTVEEIFAPSGRLSEREGFEYRPQQGKMAVAIAETLEQQKHLVVEAPTGVGKSLAYLIPTVLHAERQRRKAIVSTHTKNLQEQLARKDIPLVGAILGKKVHAVVLKGRGNYLCISRLQRALASTASLFNANEERQLKRIAAWARDTREGDMESLGFTPDPAVWDMVCSEKGICNKRTCGNRCFFQRAKESVRLADLVVMNHALFFSLMALQGAEDHFVFENDFVIFDEAHTLEAVAGAGVGKKLSRYQVMLSIHRLYHPKTKKGLLASQRKSVTSLCADVESAAVTFFESVHFATQSIAMNAGNHYAREIRVRTPRVVEDTISGPLKELEQEVSKISKGLGNQDERRELKAAVEYLWEAQILVDEFLEQPEPGFVYWVALAGARGTNVTLCAAPANIAASVGPLLFKRGTSVVMTSATLAVNNSLHYFTTRLGARGAEEMILDTPFDFRRQMSLSIAGDIPEPDSPEYATLLPLWILQSVDRTKGKALVLFTSSSLMRHVAAHLDDAFKERHITLLVQGSNYPRHTLLEEFKRDIDSVLFGLDSFWMGIDVPGEALEHVIITRLPFAVPNHPLIEAKIEAITNRGGNAFTEYTLPEAVLKLRQGVGRLIRNRNDRGVVTILDSRLVKKSYGRFFLNSLPQCQVEVMTKTGDTMYLEEWTWL